MKNTLRKRLLSIVLALMMIVSIVPLNIFTVSATSGANNGVAVKMAQLQAMFPDRSHFTVNGRACGHGSLQYCPNCSYKNVANNRLKFNWSNVWDGYTCFGFSLFVTRYIFGSEWKWGGFSVVGSASVSDQNACNALFSKARLGDELDFGGAHQAIFLSNGTNGIYIYHANVGQPNIVRYNQFKSWTDIKNEYGNINLTVRRMNNYDKVNGTTYEIVNQGVVKNSEINTSATIKLSTVPEKSMPNNWGFFLSTNRNTVVNANMTDTYKSIRREVTTKQGYVTEWGVAENYGEDLQPGTVYYFKFWAKFGNDYKFSGVESFRTTNDVPKATKLTVDSSSAEIGIGVSPTVGWTVQENDPNWKSRSFSIELRDSNGNTVQQRDNISFRSSKTQFNFTFDPIMQAGQYKVFLTAKNKNRETQATPVGTIIVHPDVNVTFVDADPQSFVDWQEGDGTEPQTYVKTCTWGKTPEVPNFPSHDGYTFDRWDKDVRNVTEDTTVTAIYNRNSYTVNFVDEKGNVLDTQSVLYYASAVAPSYQTSETGYVFTNWDKDFSCVKDNMTVKAVIDWYNNNYSVFTTITSAKRDSDNSGYDISITVTNNANTFTIGRAVIALKTEEGKLLTTTESSAFAVKAGKTRSLDVFVPYENAAKKVYVYIVNDYKTMTPICTEASSDIDMGLEWTSWSTEMPAEGTYTDLESRTEYRYKVKETTKSYSTSLPGWTQGTSELVYSSSGNIDYVTNWPSGFNKSHWIYTTYNKTPKYASENSTQKTTVSTSTVGYVYWHWCRGYSGGPLDRLMNYQYTSTYNTFHAFVSSSKITNKARDGSNRCSNPSVCKDTYWWQDDTEVREVKRCTWTTYNKYYTYTRISDWSDWTTETVANPEAEESRTVYRYKPVDTSAVESNEGVSRTVSGNLGSQYAGQELTLYIYKVDEASDYSNEYIGQTKISNDGSYSFTFKLREEPTVKTGDYTVALGLEGASSLIYLDPIKAPRKAYTVVYRDWDGTELSTQTVYEGDDAVLPDESLYDNREGYHFTHWTTTNTNVKDNLEIFAEYEINTYTVVFVDWEARAVQIREYEYGAPLTAPAFEETDPGVDVVWDKIADGVTTVTQNMVVCTEYTPKTYDVVFRDFDGNVISEQNVTYGYAADVPAMDTDEDRIFLDWQFTDDNDEELESYIVTSKIDVCPKYVFNESCEPVYANVESGEYSETLSVELTTATENAVIYYTLDGSDPTGENGIKYTAPITVRDYAKLNCYCVSLGKNDSGISSYNYIVNTDMTVSDYMRVEDLPDYVKADPDYYNVQDYPAYEFKNTVTVDNQADYDAYTADGWKPTQLDYGDWSDWQDAEYTEWSEWQDEPITATDTRQVQTRLVYLDYSDDVYHYYRRCLYDSEGANVYGPYFKDNEGNELNFLQYRVCEPLPLVGVKVFNNSEYDCYGSEDDPWYLMDRYARKYQTQYRYRDSNISVNASDVLEVETEDIVEDTKYHYYRFNGLNSIDEGMFSGFVPDSCFEEIWVNEELPKSSIDSCVSTDEHYYNGTDTINNVWYKGNIPFEQCSRRLFYNIPVNYIAEYEIKQYKTVFRYRDINIPHFNYTDWTEWQDEPIAQDNSKINFEIDTREYEYEVTEPSYKYSRWVYTDNGEIKYSNVAVDGFSGEWEYSEVPQTSAYTLRFKSDNSTYFLDPDGGVWYNRTNSHLTETRTKTQYRSRYATITLYKWDTVNFALEVSQDETRESRPVSVYNYAPVKHHFVTVIPTPVTVSANGFPIEIIADGEKLTEDIYPELYGYTPNKLYKDIDCTQEWNMTTDTVTEDVTLYATYTPVKFDVTFAYADGTEIETQSVDYLESAVAPTEIELPEGYILLGWDTDDYLCVSGDMTVHARYILESEYSTVDITDAEISLLGGNSTTLTAQTSVPGKDIIWTSSDENIASVSDGVVTGISSGTTTIRATVSDSGEYDECTVIVIGNPSNQICLTSVSALDYDALGYLRGVKSNKAADSIVSEFANDRTKLRFYDITDAELNSEGLIGTGTTVKLVVDGTELDSKVFVVTGDMTGDGIINNRDVALMNRYLVNKVTPADYQILAIDVNGDGNINNRDVAMLARYLVGKENISL